MTSSHLLSITTFVYGFAAVMYVFSWIFKKSMPGKTAVVVTFAAVFGNLAGIGLRWTESYKMGIGHAPLSNLYESLIFFALVIAILHLFIHFKYKLRMIDVVASPIPFLVMAYASLNVNNAIEPLMPALQSNWLIAHVMTCFIGYSAFAIAFGISVMFLVKSSTDGGKPGITGRIPDLATLDDLTHRMVTFGFLFLSIGIITGSVWANQAWGRYWGWDPKETWSLITWLIYATLLHARMMRGWQGKRIAWLSCIGFMAVIFTYFGVNLLPGLHSYQ
ncbi:MAG: c-type cytochrome biogenesis protein CcsB [Deltaproteobacteria bacterium]|nr:c-type cytochrome biogenesis protein CcsB [Deltaproteobacteria bacterium]